MAEADAGGVAEAIFLTAFVMIGQNRQAAFAQAKADHDFVEQEQELKTNTELTRGDRPAHDRAAQTVHGRPRPVAVLMTGA